MIKLKLYDLNDNFNEIKKVCIEKEHISLYFYLYNITFKKIIKFKKNLFIVIKIFNIL